MGKNKDKKENGITVIDKTKDSGNGKDSAAQARAALEALPEEERAAILKDLGFSPRKPREKKDKEPDPRDLFRQATEQLYSRMPEIKSIVEGCSFPSSFAVTVGVDPDGLFFATLKRVRNKYGPRQEKD